MSYKSCLHLLLGQLCVRSIPPKSCSLKPMQHFCKQFKRLSSTVIDGRLLSEQLLAEIRTGVESWVEAGNRKPRLVAVLVGNDVASHTYVRNKMIAAEKTGINSETLSLPDTISELALLSRIYELNSDESVDGILVQLPLPMQINEKLICNAVIPTKDVDGFHLSNLGRLCVNLKCHTPPTSAAVMEVLKSTGVSAYGKHAVVCGRSKNVGLPIAVLLHSSSSGDPDTCDATTTICHRHTPPEMLRMLASTADILVTATGIPGLVTGDMVKEGAVVIDVGITRVTNESSGRTRLVGDVDFNSVRKKASFITPVPGGVGPVTVAMLMRNTLQAARHEVNFNWTS